MTSDAEHVTTLPGRAELLRRFQTLRGRVADFDPIVAEKLGGATVSGRGIGTAIRLSVEDLVTAGLPRMMVASMDPLLPAYVVAMVDDEEIRAAALAALEETKPKR
ncbi:hypothetical protein ACFU5N_31740 [Streptomyces albidoflavus]